MIYYITFDGARHKLACPVKNRAELMRLRNSSLNRRNLKKYYNGDKKAKLHLLQLAYNARPVNGRLAGCQHIGSFFFHDVDCYDKQQSADYKELILSQYAEYKLVTHLAQQTQPYYHCFSYTYLPTQGRYVSI